MRGADPIEAQPDFSALLDRIKGNGVRVVLVEDANRLARSLVMQELRILALISRGVRVLTATGNDLTDDSDPSRVMMRQIAGAFHQYEKARLVAKLKAARDRKRAGGGKAEGRKRWADINPELVKAAQRLRGTSLRPERSLREIAVELQKLGMSTIAARCFRGRLLGQCSRRDGSQRRRASPVQRLIAIRRMDQTSRLEVC